jgi:uracil phosphoribosyltransferase
LTTKLKIYNVEQKNLFMPVSETPAAIMGADAAPAAGSLREEVLNRCMVEELNPLIIKTDLDILRDELTPTAQFRTTADRLFRNLGVRLTEGLPTIVTEARTPTGTTIQKETIDSSGILLVSILRSGLPMAQGIAESLPDAQIVMVDMKRVEKKDPVTGITTSKPKLYYDGLSEDLNDYKEIWIPDPMLATGGSTKTAIEMLIAKRAVESSIRVISLVSAAEGISEVKKQYPKVRITTCALDKGLNDDNYIVPGLGDFGDRYYGKKGELIIPDRMNRIALVYKDGELVNQLPMPQ